MAGWGVNADIWVVTEIDRRVDGLFNLVSFTKYQVRFLVISNQVNEIKTVRSLLRLSEIVSIA